MTVTYIGPYLVIPPTKSVYMKPVRNCANHCSVPGIAPPARFCSNCGGAVLITETPVEEVKPLPITKLADSWTDWMFRPEYGQNHPRGDIWLPNRGRHGLAFHRGDEDRFVPRALDTLDAAAMLAGAQLEFYPLVNALKRDFGIEAFWEVGIFAYA
ncbi:hypothetical protein KTD31_02295 [Burkholderia multivorans]|jgi:hypothetical protein|uniref:hypothetical protein n=1 Tax=Burkholderia multivorans TaxID=87883 RepID=UPI001C232722|nr:hypothetical protein [Burkholderia multivorans]MBU9200236.1 hypothetical protein [Burkholderia multivorans]MDN8078637.1 hypothetical protein [Burkholderia multivorans]